MSDAINSVIRRTSAMVDTSGAEPPRAAQIIPWLGGGVYVEDNDATDNNIVGRISLGILGAFVLGAVAFYVWTNGIQGGG